MNYETLKGLVKIEATITMDFHFKTSELVLTVPEPDGSAAIAAKLSLSTVNTSPFDFELRSRWKSAADSGVCRYQLTNLKTKKLPGKYGFVAQLNPQRALSRRRPQDFQSINPPFDPTQFNFNLVPNQEILMRLNNSGGKSSDNVIIINISPLEFGNCLLVPNVSKNIRQMVTLEGLELVIQTMLLSSDPHLKGGFNSPGGYASVNHQHYHLYYIEEELPLERVNLEHVYGPCFAMTEFPSKGFAFQLEQDPIKLARDVHTLVSYLRENDIAHNLFLTRGKRFKDSISGVYDTLRVFVWAREPTFGVKEEIGFNPALCEIAGHLLIKEPPAFDVLTEDVVIKMLEELTIPLFQKVMAKIPDLYS